MTRLIPAIIGASWTTAALAQVRSTPRPRLDRTNYAGRTVSLAGGIAAATGVLASTLAATHDPRVRAAAGLAVATAGGLGAVDDLTEQPADSGTKGLKGHLRALGQGRVTTGAAKLLGITAASAVAGCLIASARGGSARGRAVDAVVSAGLIAGSANLVNLLDLRPGRALKVTAAAALPLAASPGASGGIAAGVAGTALAAAPADLAETTMLGDTGANALGAALGVALATHGSRGLRVGALVVTVAATLASERISFSQVIARTPVLHRIDRFGVRAP